MNPSGLRLLSLRSDLYNFQRMVILTHFYVRQFKPWFGNIFSKLGGSKPEAVSEERVNSGLTSHQQRAVSEERFNVPPPTSCE